MTPKYDAILRAVSSVPWLIDEAKARQILEVLRVRANGGRIAETEIRRITAQSKRNRGPALAAGGKVAVLPVYGVMSPRMNMMTRYSGGTSAEQLGADITALARDPSVSAIVLDVDSPGGAATGVPELAAQIRAAAQDKKIIAMVNHLAASAAYWVASQASEVVCTPSGEVGSIGVYMVHLDESQMYANAGITPTIIRAGKYKAEGNSLEPLGEDARAAMKAVIDDWYGKFTAAVATGRGTTVKDVRQNFGEGRCVSSAQALKAGMIDRVATMDELLGELTGGAGVTNGRRALSPMRRVAIRDGVVVIAFEHSWSNTVSDEPDWGDVDKASLPRIAFADKGDPGKKSTWKYPHHFVKGGTKKDENGVYTDGDLHVHTGGVNAAWSAAQGGRSGEKASQAVIDHLQHHRRALGLDKSDKTGDKESRLPALEHVAAAAGAGGFLDPFVPLAAIFVADSMPDDEDDEEYEDPDLPDDEDEEDEEDGGDDEDTESDPKVGKKKSKRAAPPPNDEECDDGEDEYADNEDPNARAARGDAARTNSGSPHQPAPRAEESTVSATDTGAPGGAPAAGDAVALERKRAKDIRALCREHKVDPEQADAIVDSGCTVDQAATKILELARAKQAARTPVVTGMTDRNEGHEFADVGEQLVAVVQAGRSGGRVDPRLDRINRRILASADGMNETTGSDGGFFLQPELLPGVLTPVYEEDPILSRVTRIPIGSATEAIKLNIVDETNRGNGSRWGGIQMFMAAEADQGTPKKPKMRQDELALHKVIGLAYLTNELQQDAPAAGALLTNAFQAELQFITADKIWRGKGTGEPLGWLSSNCIVSQAIEAGQTLANSNQSIAKNLANMLTHIPSGLKKNTIWLYNQEFLPTLVTAVVGTGGSAVPVFLGANGISGRPYDTIFGLPAFESELAEAPGTPGDIVAVVPNQFLFGDKGGPQIAMSLHFKFDTDQQALRITYRFGGLPVWNKSVTPYKGAAQRSPFVTLAARA